MKVKDFLRLYQEDAMVRMVAEKMKHKGSSVQLKGVWGSLDAILAASVYQLFHQNYLFILHDKEEAAYFYNDISNLLPEKEIFLFPTSYKRPYQFDEVENANVLMRAEVLNRLNNKSSSGEIIITYPEALTEKVINKRSLSENTFSAKIGDKVDIGFLSELFHTYDFEKTDFVYEAGQFAVRGGIIDVYSYAHELPFRIELFGNEIDNIRTFDPTSQLSVEQAKELTIVPNVQTKLLHESRQSFLEFIPASTRIWIKDFQQCTDVIDNYYKKAVNSFDVILKESGNTKVILEPDSLFETGSRFVSLSKNFLLLEFGNRFYLDSAEVIAFNSEGQPSFNKNFELLAKNFLENQSKGITNIIVTESTKQQDRLRGIFEEQDPFIEFQNLDINFRQGFVDHQLKIACYTDHQLFERFHRYKTPERFSKSKALTLKELRTLQPGDFVVHVDHGVGRFAGLEKVEVNGKEQEAIRIIYRDDDLLLVSIHALHKISKYSGKEGGPPSISKLGSPDWENKKKRIKGQVKDIAKELISLYAKRKAAPGYAYQPDSFLQAELELSFIYEDTPDQAKATSDVKNDMELPHPMDRLVCGDVGFGKTEVAIRAAFKAVTENKQVAVLVPTTILAMQHYHTFKDRLADFPVNVEYINRFKSTKDIKETLKKVELGEISMLIGTHRIVNKDVIFKDLGLLIIDEEQKFGVKVKDKLKEMKVNVDTLTLTATPIPRTLHFSLMGARDLSIIATPPPNRQPVTTEIHTFNEEIIRDAIRYEMKRNGQTFLVHNRVSDIDHIASTVIKLVPDAKVGVAHGQMDGAKLEKVMLRFIEGEYDVLVSTNIIESGLDIPNANTIIITRAHMFGLSDLHQMRGRVGRSNKKAFCYLLTPPTSAISADARRRLSALEEFTELGDGFKVAMRDLDIRGAGNLLGAEQSGFISDLGFEMYHKILDEAIQELKETEFKDLFQNELLKSAKTIVVKDCTIETDLELIIPENYVSSISERLNLYSRLDSIDNEEELSKFKVTITDRFGSLPEPVIDLIETVKLRWLAENVGFEKLVLKSGSMKGYFPSDNDEYFRSESFGKVLQYVQKRHKICKLKELKGKPILVVDEILNVQNGIKVLSEILS